MINYEVSESSKKLNQYYAFSCNFVRSFIIIFCLASMYLDLSQKWKNECQLIKQISHPLDLKSFGYDKMQKNIAKEFKVVQHMTQTQFHLDKFYVNPDHFSYNRNANIMTFDKNRVLLSEAQNKDSPDHYINANFVEISDHKVIATQGPLHSTINNFWRMIYKYKVPAIFMLCEKVEKQKVKCDLYWPNQVQEIMTAGEIQIKLLKKQEDGKYIKIKRFIIKNKGQNEERELTHYQFKGWPDGDKPLQTSQNSLNKLVDVMITHLEKDENVVIHCSAGVGRTGTFIAMAEIKMLIPKTQAISIFQIVRKLRQQRWGMVYTANQYQFLYQFTEKESLKFLQPQAQEENKQFSESSGSIDSPDQNDEQTPECS